MKPIIFNTEMVKAILNGRKTMTRRVIKPQPEYIGECFHNLVGITEEMHWRWKPEGSFDHKQTRTESELKAYAVGFAKYQPGDVLYVKEAWGKRDDPDGNLIYFYLASYDSNECEWAPVKKWKSPATMPKEAARIFLRVTDVMVERVQDISEQDAIAEGISDSSAYDCNGWAPSYNDPDSGGQANYVGAFELLWDNINAKKGYSWESNPWVWVISFERIEKS